MMKTHETEPTLIRSLSHEGRGIGCVNGKTTFIENALPGETVVWKLLKTHRKYNEGLATEILEKSKDRVEPQCIHFSQCGGCQLQHLSKEAQITLKQNVLLEQLQHFGNITPEAILPPLSGANYGYRRKARLGVRFVHKKNKVLVGFREKRSGKLADLSLCEVLEPKFGALIAPLQTLIGNLSIYSAIPQLEIALGSHEKAIVFRHMEPFSQEDKTLLIEFAQQYSVSVFLQPAGNDSVHRLYPEYNESNKLNESNVTHKSNESLSLSYILRDQNLSFQFHPLDFIQVNAEMNQAMINSALTLLQLNLNDRVLDLFCGLGNFTLPLAQQAKSVVGVEGSASMIEQAKRNSVQNGFQNVEFFTGNLHESSTTLLNQQSWFHQTYDKILLDPPRSGALELMHYLPKFKASRIVYISCNPATMARDLKILTQSYRLLAAGIIDMFPHTAHVESIAVLER